MTDDVWKRDEPDSPCQSICMIHPRARICVGCFRTGEEIAAWPRLSPEARKHLMAELPSRSDQLRAPKNRASKRRKTRE